MARRSPMARFDGLYSNSIKTLKCFYWPDAFASGETHTMRGDLQCNKIFFQPKGWKNAVRLHRSHKTVITVLWKISIIHQLAQLLYMDLYMIST
jgi:hypothetical protein